MNRLFKASVIENRLLVKNHHLLTLHPLEKIKKTKPGNFFMVSVDNGLEPLLKRPLSVHRILGQDFQLLYRVMGKGTSILSRKKPDDILEILGPLGNGFPLNIRSDNITLVAGGIGIAPIFALAESLNAKRPVLFYGARLKKEILCLSEMDSIGIKPVIATDDGSAGKKDNIVNLLKQHISRSRSRFSGTILYACGPTPMLKALSVFAQKNGLGGYFAMEQHMACGIGTCLGCVIKTTKGYKRVCKEGPVFPIEEIVWE
ncbi:MAG: dihydroorotate dehydrogenase electron transfer subunit [Nitrospirota bacterium]